MRFASRSDIIRERLTRTINAEKWRTGMSMPADQTRVDQESEQQFNE
jgi:Arc/MetJ-type ribon-helix-helix transcriptional regulator